MKKRTLFACGLAAALFAGCSSDDVTVDNGNITNGGSGFLALNISLPSTNGGSRASDDHSNEHFDQGDSKEYSISNISLICYDASGKAVESFTYTDAQAWSTKPTTPNGITTDAVLKVQPVNNTVAKILVLVNVPDILTIGTNGILTYGGTQYNKCTVDGKIQNDDGSQTLALQNVDLTGGGNKFFMSNAPLSDGTNTTVLVNVVPKESEAAAQADIRTVNVERACSKVAVTCADSWGGTSYTLDAAGYIGDKVTFNEWLLDIKNNKEYPVRIYDKGWETLTGLSIQRFRGIGEEAKKYIGNDGNKFYRTYWGKDPNYDSYIAGDFTLVTDESEFNGTHSLGINAPQYCNENTFDTNHMAQDQTTRVVLQATYVPNTSNGFTTNPALSASDASDTGTWYQLGNSNKPYNVDMINTLINGIDGCSEVTLKREALNAGAKQTFDITMFNFPSTADDDAKQALVNKITKVLGNITVYKKGVCYYAVRIKHFGETYTPWTDGDNYVGTDITNEEAKYLGRYGVLRNNSYQLELNSVTAPGTPTIPNAPSSSDDEQNTYIQATVKIMDWAVRKQSVNL